MLAEEDEGMSSAKADGEAALMEARAYGQESTLPRLVPVDHGFDSRRSPLGKEPESIPALTVNI
jgi:hypothetical protein